jgi:hypothetical protein
MKSLLAFFFSLFRPKPAFVEDEDFARAQRIAALKRLLAEIAEPPAEGDRFCVAP